MTEVSVSEQQFELPKDLQEVIDKIPSQVPEVFKNQAKMAARYIAELDNGVTDEDKGREKFKEQLGRTGFINRTYVHHSLNPSFTKAADPKDALPPWLYNPNTHVVKHDQEKDKKIQEMYDKWTNKPIFVRHQGPNGFYSDFPNQDNSSPITHKFKTYVEGINLEAGLASGDIQEVLHKLTIADLNPNSMKLYESFRLVLYFGRDIKLASKIRDKFKEYNLNLRGSAQDTYQIEIDKNGKLQLKEFASNDSSLGSGNLVKYKLKKYDPAQFLDNYLQMCLYAGKDPSEPYKTSFVWFMDHEGKAKENEQIKLEAEKLAAYPVLYARHRFDLVRK